MQSRSCNNVLFQMWLLEFGRTQGSFHGIQAPTACLVFPTSPSSLAWRAQVTAAEEQHYNLKTSGR